MKVEGVQGLGCQPMEEFQRRQGRGWGSWLGCPSVQSHCSRTNCSMEQEAESTNLTMEQGPSKGGGVGVELKFQEVGMGCSGIQTLSAQELLLNGAMRQTSAGVDWR
jgi:hypothetical protein